VPGTLRDMVERRLTWLASIILLWGGAIFFKLISLQVIHHRQYVQMARARQELVVEIPAPRGTLFDRSGRVLAMSTPAETVYINPQKVDIQVATDILAGSLHLDRVELYGDIRSAYENHRGYLIIKRRISDEESDRLHRLGLEWIGFQRESQRHYPKGELAAHVLGSVDFEEKGNAGVEKALDADLRGKPGQMRLLTDVKRRGIESTLATEARPGTPVTLSIDERIQFVAERELAVAVQEHHATTGSVVVMNPYTGEVLALASYPTYDPNQPPQPGEALNRQDHAVSVPFEPGSVFKVITLSAALETTSLTPDSPINCHGGVLRLPGRVVHDSHGGLGVIPMATVLAKSSNIGAIEVGMRVGQDNMYNYVRRFGFGQRTGIDLPAESPGQFRKVSRWGKTSLASISMGQEVSVTSLQLAQAAAAVANGGLLVRPRLILKKGDREVSAARPVRIIRPETSITMRQMMEGVVLHGTGTRAKVAGYTVGGKTGSAQIFDRATHHYTHSYNGSFLGMAPVTNPAIVAVVTLNGTHGEGGFGGVVAAPVFHAVVSEALRVLDTPKDLPDEPPAKTLVAKAADLDDLADADNSADEPNILEDGDDDAPAGAPAQPVPAGPKVPNFRGMSMRAVLAEAAAKGITVIPAGSGIARLQTPAPGAVLHQGERIRVQFSR
jgi:cell division protein FtsI (penicillin-binding protein 3)